MLRVSSGDTHLWTHYDVADNVLMQVVGTKTVTLFPPHEAPRLYVQGSSSRIPADALATPAALAASYPAAIGPMCRRMEVTLKPGDALFIPSLWFHSVTSGPGLSVALNVFFKGLPCELYDSNDPYGNRDLPEAVRAAAAAADAARSLARLPQPHRAFYARRAAEPLLALADDEDAARGEDA